MDIAPNVRRAGIHDDLIAGEPIVLSVPADLDMQIYDDFANLIDEVRRRVSSDELAFGVAVMNPPAAVDTPERYMEVRFDFHGKHFSFYIDRSDLYVIGVKVGGTAYYYNDCREETRNYLRRRNVNLKHIVLPFSGSYPGSMCGFEVGFRELEQTLYDLDKDRIAKLSKSMLVPVVMVSEGSRFRYLHDSIMEGRAITYDYVTYKLSSTDDVRLHNWGHISKTIVRNHRMNTGQGAPSPELMGQLKSITNVHQLALLKPPHRNEV